jgi:hypothetical protein
LPALNVAKQKAKVIVCIGNLKQTGLAMFNYAADWKDWTPQINDEFGKTAPNENRSWMSKLYNNNYVMEPQVGNPTIFLCPSQDPWVWNAAPTKGSHSYAYGMTSFNGTPAWRAAWRLRSIIVDNYGNKISGGSPSKFILLADSTLDLPGNAGHEKQRYYIYFSNDNSRIRLIHNRAASIFVGDGHVETLNRAGLSSEYGWTNTYY